MSYRIALVCEGNTDRDVVRCLTDRLIAETVDWAAEQMEDAVSWVGYDTGTEHLPWSHVKRLAQATLEPISRKVFGDRLPNSEEAITARKALLLFDRLPAEGRPDVVVLQRDEDRDEGRRQDLDLARGNYTWGFTVVVGVARPMIESWILAGFIPAGDERGRHRDTCDHLTFDPCQSGERLSPNHADPTKRPKHVLETLTGADPARTRSCYEDTPFDHLRATGEANGLADFLDEVRSRLIPALGGPPVSPP